MSILKLIPTGGGGGSVQLKAPSSTASNSDVELTLPTDIGSNDQFLKLGSVSGKTGALSFAAAGGGKILQIVQTVKSDTTSLSSTTTFTDISGMTVDITPSAGTSKILVQFSVNLSNLSNGHVDIRLVRDSTAIAIGDADSNRGRVTVSKEAAAHGNGMEERSMTFLESVPGGWSSGAITYKLQWKTGLVDAVLNRSKNDTDNEHHPRGISTITVWEVGA